MIELLIVVVISAILAGIAIPAYSRHSVKLRRSQAHAAMMSLELQQEKFRMNCGVYAINLGATADCNSRTIKYSGPQYEDHYTLRILSDDNHRSTYRLTAFAKEDSTQSKDGVCRTMWRTLLGERGPAKCW